MVNITCIVIVVVIAFVMTIIVTVVIVSVIVIIYILYSYCLHHNNHNHGSCGSFFLAVQGIQYTSDYIVAVAQVPSRARFCRRSQDVRLPCLRRSGTFALRDGAGIPGY